ncbi:MAG: methionine adenosyltransferase [Patescibacteria group bacterium]
MLFTSESVTSGHPDKICDQISDAILDECLVQDPLSKVAVDTWVKDNFVGIIGELTTTASLDFEDIARKKILEIGYNRDELEFNSHNCDIQVKIGKQSNEINQAVVKDDLDVGAGDQGIMFGLACNQTEELMPLPIILSHKLASQLERIRKEMEANNDFRLRPDGKTQVTIEFDNKLKIQKIETILISTQHSNDITQAEIKTLLHEKVIDVVINEMSLDRYFTPETKVFINPSGSFVIGGPVADSGLTGRKIVVDGYGGWGRVGGGAFSGKDATKVDRSGAYIARFLAKQVVAKGWATECEIQLSYAIGKAEPVSLGVFGSLHKSEAEIINYLKTNYDLSPKSIIQNLNLQLPIFSKTSTYGHFGRQPERGFFTWEMV